MAALPGLLEDNSLATEVLGWLGTFAEVAALEGSRGLLRSVRQRAPYEAMYLREGGTSPLRRRSQAWWRQRLRVREAMRGPGVKMGGRRLPSLGRLPVEVGGCAMATFDDGTVWLHGGASRNFALEDRAWLWIHGGWTQVEGPSARWQHTATTAGSTVFVFGGEVEDARWAVDGALYAVTRAGSRSTRCQVVNTRAPIATSGHSCHFFADTGLVFFGGRIAETKCTSTVRCFCDEHWTIVECSGQEPSSRWCHSAAATSDRLVVFGGWDVPTRTFFSDVHVLDVANRVWTTLVAAPGPRPRAQAPCFLLPTAQDDDLPSLLVFGGAHTEEVDVVTDLDDLWLLDAETAHWQRLASDSNLAAFRGGCNAALHLDRATKLLCGGIRNSCPPHHLPSFVFLDACLELVVCDSRLHGAMPLLGPLDATSPPNRRRRRRRGGHRERPPATLGAIIADVFL